MPQEHEPARPATRAPLGCLVAYLVLAVAPLLLLAVWLANLPPLE